MNMLPKLSPAKEAALRDSIKEFGVLVPIVRDQHGVILDGHNRKRIADDLGQSCPEADPIEVRDDEHRAKLVIEINDQRREALTREQKRAIHISLREKGHSLRDIGSVTGMDKHTVSDDVKSIGGIPPIIPPRVKTTDGRTYPSTRAPRGGKPTPSELKKQEEREEEEKIRQRIEADGRYVRPGLVRQQRELRGRLHQSIVQCRAIIGEALRKSAELDRDFAQFGTVEKLRELRGQALELMKAVEAIPTGNKESDSDDLI